MSVLNVGKPSAESLDSVSIRGFTQDRSGGYSQTAPWKRVKPEFFNEGEAFRKIPKELGKLF